ncbi:MAG TPA: TAT-variant-translocated molybdopterin oxidoreductase [Bryobacteraceae bacterium]|nr:TAT-variant-translocated molybdopterin oxidoreductase [Bryobacteraceae bacterium]
MIQIQTKTSGKEYWRSLDELAGTPKFQEWVRDEFPSTAGEMLSGTSRRNVLKLMAASFGLAGLTACRRPVEHILPNVRGVEGYIPGKPWFYATAMSQAGSGMGLLVEVHDGRPTKIEGNPDHPFSLGATNSFHQASVLSLYDPDRMRNPVNEERQAKWEDFNNWIKQAFDRARFGGGNGWRILSERVTSPSLAALRTHVASTLPNVRWVEWDGLAADSSALGTNIQPLYNFEKADVVLSLDSDFLHQDAGGTVLPMKQYGRRRRIGVDDHDGEMNRLYVIEGRFSLTGSAADHRLRMRPSEIGSFAADLAGRLGSGGNQLQVVGEGSGTDLRARWLSALVKDLAAHRGRSLVIAGPRQPAAVHALAHQINQALGNVGATVTYVQLPAGDNRPQLEVLRELVRDMSSGAVSHLLVLGGNPAFTAPADFNFEANLRKVSNSLYLGQEYDETAAACRWAVPEAHYLESWGDVAAPDGTVTIQQPMIQPLYGGRTAAEIVALISGYKDQQSYQIVRNLWEQRLGGEKGWRKALHDGIVPNTAWPTVNPALNTAGAAQPQQGASSGIELQFVPSSSVYDGRFANNGWLQELPDPMTKLTWDNAALLSPATAKQLGVAVADVITIERGGRRIEAPVMIQPGQADNLVVIAVGYGRRVCGNVGRGVGVNAYLLRTSDAMTVARDIRISKAGGRYNLAFTEEHHIIGDLGAPEVQKRARGLVRELPIEEYREDPKAVAEMTEKIELFQLYETPADYSRGNQWGMAIDLNVCTGCNACVVACQAENNVPIVGKEQVARGREMHWLRLDRYYKGDAENPTSISEPILCMHCETAPCENVCPVAATVHSPEGLNDMAYNRCVGTRYCSNNCPYKVRRFNFLNWHKDVAKVTEMVFQPDVTVRMRGVMEKCTYCVQRIQDKKIELKSAERRLWITDADHLQTACQQACPSEAIVFGNINDPDSMVAKLKQLPRNYGLLEELNTRPRTTYLACLRNPNPELEGRHG